MRTQEMIQTDLDAVARTFPDSRGSMLGKISIQMQLARPIPLPVKRFDFLATNGELSKDEAKLVRK